MQVRRLEPGFAVCEGRGEVRRVSTILLADVEQDDWLLVFLGDARERLSAQRAAQVNAALDLVGQAMAGSYSGDQTDTSADSDMPSAMSLEQLNRLTGGG